jgi:putative ABC transport system permease protein
VATFSVVGLDPAATIGPLAAAELVDGRLLESSDSGDLVAVVDEAYATSESLVVGDTMTVGDSEVEIVGIVASTSEDATTLANVYLPLDTAQTLAGLDGQVSTVAVQASSADQVDAIAADLEQALPDSTVSTQADLASSITGSLSSAAGLIANLGTWLSVLVLAAAFLLAILLTISGVTRRTREFGTLKAIGWTNGRVVRQVAGESFVQGIIGGAVGVAVGLGGILLVNLIAPTFSATTSSNSGLGGLFGGGPPSGTEGGVLPGGGSGPTDTVTSGATTEVALQAPVTISVILIAVALAVLGGLLAGVIGGWRAARLRPAEALRSAA